MADLNLYRQYKEYAENDIALSYEGSMSQDIIVCLADSLELKMLCEDEYSRFLKRIFSVFIELAQNITKYSAERIKTDCSGKEVGIGTISLRKYEDRYTVASGNLVSHESARVVVDSCKKINNLDREGLKRLYRIQIKKTIHSSRGGGLGLIDMARKSRLPIQCEVYAVDDEHSYMVISVDVLKEVKR